MSTPIDLTPNTPVLFKAQHVGRQLGDLMFYVYTENREPIFKDGAALAYSAKDEDNARRMHQQMMDELATLAAREARIQAEFESVQDVLRLTHYDLHPFAMNKRLENIDIDDLKDPRRPYMRAGGVVLTGRDGRSIVLKHKYKDAHYIIPA